MADSKEAGKLLPEEPYEWHGTGLSADGSISLESPRKWRLVKEQTGHGALHGLRIVVYGDCAIPSLVSNTTILTELNTRGNVCSWFLNVINFWSFTLIRIR